MSGPIDSGLEITPCFRGYSVENFFLSQRMVLKGLKESKDPLSIFEWNLPGLVILVEWEEKPTGIRVGAMIKKRIGQNGLYPS